MIGTSTHCKVVGKEPPEDKVPHPETTHLALSGDQLELGKQAGRTLELKLNGDFSLRMTASLFWVALL